MPIDRTTYLILSTLVASIGLGVVYFRHHIYEWLFPLPADFAENAPPASLVRFEGTLARAIPPFVAELGLTLLFGALTAVMKGGFEAALFGFITLCLMGKAAHTFHCTILHRPFLELNPHGLCYWPGHGPTIFWGWDELGSIETRRQMVEAHGQAGTDRWEHTHRFTHLILHRPSSTAEAHGKPIELDFLQKHPQKTRLVISLPVLGPPRLIAKILDRYRRQVHARKRHPVRKVS